MKSEERLILARLLSRDHNTIPMIFSVIELVEQKPLTEEERKEILAYIKEA